MELDPKQEKIVNSMYKRLCSKSKASIEGIQRITYSLSTTRAGRLGYGRLYGTIGSLETLERECRGTICRDNYIDIDVVNCHPVLLIQLAQRKYNLRMPEVGKYVDDRDSYLAQVSDNRDDAKESIIKIFYGGKCAFPFLEPLRNEVQRFTKMLTQQPEYKELFHALRSEDNVYGSFLSYILQTEERHVMLAMKAALEAAKFSVDVLCYDGVMVRKAATEPDLKAVEAAIQAATGYKVQLVIKPFRYYDVPTGNEEVAKGVMREEYEKRKAHFEETHFYSIPQDAIIKVCPNGTLTTFSLQHAATALNGWDWIHSTKLDDRTPFIKLWLSDPGRKQINVISMKPSDDPETFVTPLRPAWAEVTLVDDPGGDALHLWNSLLELAANGDGPKRDYMEKWFAHILQKPFELPGVCLVLTGQKGVGKDTLGDFFMTFVLGPHLCTNYSRTEQYFEKHDTGRFNKLLVKLEEANSHLVQRNDASFKGFITAKSLTINPKGTKEIAFENFVRTIITTNDGHLCDDLDRRGVYYRVSDDMKGNHEFWEWLRSDLFTEAGGAIVGKSLMAVDLNGWNPRNIPPDAYKEQIAEALKTAEQRFVEQWDDRGEGLSSAELFRQYRTYCHENELSHAFSVQGFGKKLNPFVRDDIIERRVSNGKTLYFKKAK